MGVGGVGKGWCYWDTIVAGGGLVGGKVDGARLQVGGNLEAVGMLSLTRATAHSRTPREGRLASQEGGYHLAERVCGCCVVCVRVGGGGPSKGGGGRTAGFQRRKLERCRYRYVTWRSQRVEGVGERGLELARGRVGGGACVHHQSKKQQSRWLLHGLGCPSRALEASQNVCGGSTRAAGASGSSAGLPVQQQWCKCAGAATGGKEACEKESAGRAWRSC